MITTTRFDLWLLFWMGNLLLAAILSQDMARIRLPMEEVLSEEGRLEITSLPLAGGN